MGSRNVSYDSIKRYGLLPRVTDRELQMKTVLVGRFSDADTLRLSDVTVAVYRPGETGTARKKPERLSGGREVAVFSCSYVGCFSVDAIAVGLYTSMGDGAVRASRRRYAAGAT
jgi:hypothetical protein